MFLEIMYGLIHLTNNYMNKLSDNLKEWRKIRPHDKTLRKPTAGDYLMAMRVDGIADGNSRAQAIIEAYNRNKY